MNPASNQVRLEKHLEPQVRPSHSTDAWLELCETWNRGPSYATTPDPEKLGANEYILGCCIPGDLLHSIMLSEISKTNPTLPCKRPRQGKRWLLIEPFSSPGDLPDSGIEPGSPALQANSLPTELPGKPNQRFSSVQFSCSVVSYSLGPHESKHARPPCP